MIYYKDVWLLTAEIMVREVSNAGLTQVPKSSVSVSANLGLEQPHCPFILYLKHTHRGIKPLTFTALPFPVCVILHPFTFLLKYWSFNLIIIHIANYICIYTYNNVYIWYLNIYICIKYRNCVYTSVVSCNLCGRQFCHMYQNLLKNLNTLTY